MLHRVLPREGLSRRKNKEKVHELLADAVSKRTRALVHFRVRGSRTQVLHHVSCQENAP